jgi:hypothetical protein
MLCSPRERKSGNTVAFNVEGGRGEATMAVVSRRLLALGVSSLKCVVVSGRASVEHVSIFCGGASVSCEEILD